MLSSRSRNSEVLALLDIGSSKIACLIAERRNGAPGAGADLRVLGFGQRQSEGVRGGMVVDLDRAEISMRGAIGDAEEQAGLTVDELTIALSSSRLSSSHFTAHLDLEAGQVRPEDLKRLAGRARQYAERDGRSLIYLNRIHYSLDGETGISEPNKMLGSQLTCQYHAVTADPAPLRNLECLVERCYLSVRNFVPTGLASAIGATTRDEQHYGVTCIDIGAGAVKIAVIGDSRFLHTDTMALGGAPLTHDIAVALGAPVAEAERIKTLCGAIGGVYPGSDSIRPYWQAGTDGFIEFRSQQGELQETTRAELGQVLYPRARRQLELIRERLDKSSVTRELAKSVVLTGGASLLTGFSGLAAQILGRPVRVGQPMHLDGIASELQGPGMSSVVGLGLVDASPAEMLYAGGVKNRAYESYLSRMEQWLRESF